MDVKTGIGIGTGLITIVVAMFAVDARYTHSAQAQEMIKQQIQSAERLSIARERGDLESQLEVVQLELKYLTAKPTPTTDELLRIKFLSDKETFISQRLIYLNSQ